MNKKDGRQWRKGGGMGNGGSYGKTRKREGEEVNIIKNSYCLDLFVILNCPPLSLCEEMEIESGCVILVALWQTVWHLLSLSSFFHWPPPTQNINRR